MEDLLARQRAAEQHVRSLLNNDDEPILTLLKAFEDYRQLTKSVILADFENEAGKKGVELWSRHVDGRKHFHRYLSKFRKATAKEQPVATRSLIKFYLTFIKDSQRFYHDYIAELNGWFGGIPELEAVAHQLKGDGQGESSKVVTSPELSKKVLQSCHHSLICLGDLMRYRASEKLDKKPDFGPAIGYYGLACSLRPMSGMGHHQMAVIALDPEQRRHFRAIYHLYRSLVVEEPHPNAANNLSLEFEKINAAWERGELVPKSQPNDPEAAKRTLEGWFIHLHSMCFKGQPFRGYEELEREVMGQLSAQTKRGALDNGLMRMLMVNMAAQHNASENFQKDTSEENKNAFLHFFTFNIKTFTTLLNVFYDELRSIDLSKPCDDNADLASVASSSATDDDAELAERLNKLAKKLNDPIRRVLPPLRLYSAWLLPMTDLLAGLATDTIAKEAIEQFWIIYAKAVDLVGTVFVEWDIEAPKLTYMLEEDAETLCFKPVIDEKTNKIWYDPKTGALRPRFSDVDVQRASVDAEMLVRVKGFFEDGFSLANGDPSACIKLRGLRILHRDAEDVEPEPMPVIPSKPTAEAMSGVVMNGMAPTLEPRSYAVAAAHGPVPAPTKPAVMTNGVSSDEGFGELEKMVDDLVDGDESNNPVTPPQQVLSYPPAVVSNEYSFASLAGSVPDPTRRPKYTQHPYQRPLGTPGGASKAPAWPSPNHATNGTAMDRLQSVSSLWNDMSALQLSDTSPALPTNTLASPAQLYSRGHSRVNSASSIRSRTSQNLNLGIADSWSSLDTTAPNATRPGPLAGLGGLYPGSEKSNVATAWLFGAGGGPFSAAPGVAIRNTSPPGGQVG